MIEESKLSLNIPHLIYFLSKNCTRLPENSHPLFSSNPLKKLRSCQAPPPFLKILYELQPAAAEKERVHTTVLWFVGYVMWA